MWGRCATMQWGRGGSPPWLWKWIPAPASSRPLPVVPLAERVSQEIERCGGLILSEEHGRINHAASTRRDDSHRGSLQQRDGEESPPPSPQERHSFTIADQVNLLVGASEADPDRGFMARTMALCSLPRSNPGNRTQYKRVNGPFTLYMNTTADTNSLTEICRAS